MRLIMRIIVLVLLLLIPVPVAAQGLTALPPNVKLVALGDSISAGWGSPPIRGARLNGYVAQLHRQLLARGQAELHNLGVPGLTSGQLLFLLDHWPEASHFLKHATVITLSIGGNDIIWTDHQSPGDAGKMRDVLTKYERNIETILEKIRALNPQAAIFVLEVYNPFPVDDQRHETFRPWVQWVNESIDHAATYHEADVIPTAALFNGHEKECVNLANNDIHPNITGHTRIAETISRMLLQSFVPLVVSPNMEPNLLWNGSPLPVTSGMLLENDTVYIETDELARLHGTTLQELHCHVGDWWANVNGQRVRLPSPVLLKDGHPFLPLRAVAESLGAQVFWIADSKTMSVVTSAAKNEPSN